MTQHFSMNLDLFADLDEPVAPPAPAPAGAEASAVTTPVAQALPLGPAFSAKAREWAVAAIAQLAAAGDSLTRLKNLKADETAYEALLQACLLVAWRKSTAYRRAYSGTAQEQRLLTGWLLRDPELGRATELFTRSHLAVNELAMLPTAFHPVVD